MDQQLYSAHGTLILISVPRATLSATCTGRHLPAIGPESECHWGVAPDPTCCTPPKCRPLTYGPQLEPLSLPASTYTTTTPITNFHYTAQYLEVLDVGLVLNSNNHPSTHLTCLHHRPALPRLPSWPTTPSLPASASQPDPEKVVSTSHIAGRLFRPPAIRVSRLRPQSTRRPRSQPSQPPLQSATCFDCSSSPPHWVTPFCKFGHMLLSLLNPFLHVLSSYNLRRTPIASPFHLLLNATSSLTTPHLGHVLSVC